MRTSTNRQPAAAAVALSAQRDARLLREAFSIQAAAATPPACARAPRAAAETPLGWRIAAFVYGLACYAVFFVTFLYAYGFVGNIVVPKSIDAAPTGPFHVALIVNLALLGIFAVQHSVMARPSFKRHWTKVVPEPVERSTYTLLSSLALILLFWQWRPMGGVVWSVNGDALRLLIHAVFTSGWLIVLVSTFLINHFDLFGLRQVWLFLRGKEYTHLRFRTPGPYRRVRHPLYLGWLVAFWATPTMTAAHLVFALATTAYILVAIRLEERNLVQYHGEDYAKYRKAVPMLVPVPGKRWAERS